MTGLFPVSIAGKLIPQPVKDAAVALGTAIVVAGTCIPVSHCIGVRDGKHAEQLKTQKAVDDALKTDRAARDKADVQRGNDQTANTTMETTYHAEIAKAAPGGHNSDAATRLACQRLRNNPRRGAAPLPAQCGR
jgi:hypothetical protein